MSIIEIESSGECDADKDPWSTRPDGYGCDEVSDYTDEDEDD